MDKRSLDIIGKMNGSILDGPVMPTVGAVPIDDTGLPEDDT
jgi:hypothetical protein